MPQLDSKMFLLVSTLVANLGLTALGCGGEVAADVDVVAELDLERYDGVWFERASFPQSFQEGCFCTTAEYEIRADDVGVTNRCNIDGPNGERNVAEGRAFFPDPDIPSKLKVEFFWPFAGDYWVTELGNEDGEGDYTYAVVTDPSKEYFWILTRDPLFPDASVDEIADRYAEQGWPMDRLNKTDHEECIDGDG